MRRSTPKLALACALASAVAAASCIDPVHADAVAALGPEAAGVREGPTHRPGQPCTVCHGGSGPGSPEFSVAGTVFLTRGADDPAVGVDVVLIAADGSTRTERTNAVGNFYITRREWDPPFPLRVELQQGGTSKKMETRAGGDGWCGVGHRSQARGGGDSRHMPGVFLRDK